VDADPADGDPLVGDGVTAGIVRIGDTVRRPVRPFSTTVQAYLTHLHAVGFHDAPRPLGFDEQGRETLSFVDGDIPRAPLSATATTGEVLVALAHLVRRLHDAAEGWRPPAGAVWGRIPGRPGGAMAGVGGDQPQLVSHCDYCPGNVVFRQGLPAALIDFDLARPTTRVEDVANALYWWAPLLDPVDRAPSLRGADVPARVARFADAYGMTGAQRAALPAVAADMIGRFHRSARAAAQVDPVFRGFWDDGVKDRMPRAEAWIREHASRIAAAVGGADG
jgi:hypothetical protein